VSELKIALWTVKAVSLVKAQLVAQQYEKAGGGYKGGKGKAQKDLRNGPRRSGELKMSMKKEPRQSLRLKNIRSQSNGYCRQVSRALAHINRNYGQLDKNVFGGLLPGGAATPIGAAFQRSGIPKAQQPSVLTNLLFMLQKKHQDGLLLMS
jgi:hypothetical protein